MWYFSCNFAFYLHCTESVVLTWLKFHDLYYKNSLCRGKMNIQSSETLLQNRSFVVQLFQPELVHVEDDAADYKIVRLGIGEFLSEQMRFQPSISSSSSSSNTFIFSFKRKSFGGGGGGGKRGRKSAFPASCPKFMHARWRSFARSLARWLVSCGRRICGLKIELSLTSTSLMLPLTLGTEL